MTNDTRRCAGWGRAAAIGGALVTMLFSIAGCGRGLLGISSQGHDDGTGGMRGDPAGPSVCFADHPASCNQTCLEATRVLETNCAQCHTGDRAFGAPVFGFLFDPEKLVRAKWTRQDSTVRFLKPGDPDNSAIYFRPVTNQDMPPISTPLSSPGLPRVTASDGQILRELIANCMGPDPLAPPVPDASVDTGPPPPDPTVGQLVSCPAAVPSGSCGVEQLSCAYPTASCVCHLGGWDCVPCPAEATGSNGHCDRRHDGTDAYAVRCRYGGVSCTCLDQGIPYSTWQCGVCPASKPPSGQACGNASFACDYGGDTCSCTGNGWTCQTVECPRAGATGRMCTGSQTCVYAALDSVCSCQNARWNCTCPGAAPTEGSVCAGPAGCDYGDQSCACGDSPLNGTSTWHCTPKCPVAAPASGTSCSSSLSCSYPDHLCYCDGQAWHC